MNIFAIETSCDETSAAILIDNKVDALVIHSQECHTKYGGIIPELASREHDKYIVEIASQALERSSLTSWNDVDVFCATAGPGLVGALLVGLKFTEAMAFALKKPFIPINHIEGHIFSALIEEDIENKFPYLSLVVSGGHTLLAHVDENLHIEYVGKTRDDAAGEAFDKIGKMLGLPYPAGPIIDKLSQTGDPAFHRFPRSFHNEENLEFSFSGLKTSVLNYIKGKSEEYIKENLPHILASVQEAIVDALLEKTLLAARQYRTSMVAISGGVSANSRLREKFSEVLSKKNIHVSFPKKIYSTDNAAMIGMVAKLKMERENKQTDLLTKPSKPYQSKAFARLQM